MLPNDGYPRITSHAITLIQQGLKGNFDGWRYVSYCNHPWEIPPEDCQNCHIMASEDWKGKPQFIVQVWFGRKCPLLHGCNMVPDIEFSEIDLLEYYEPPSVHIVLKNTDWYAHVPIAVDDRGLGKGNIADEDGEEEQEEEQECGCDLIQQAAKSKQTGLEAFL